MESLQHLSERYRLQPVTRNYILTMLFLKYVNDINRTKYQEYLQRYDGDTERARRAMRRERF